MSARRSPGSARPTRLDGLVAEALASGAVTAAVTAVGAAEGIPVWAVGGEKRIGGTSSPTPASLFDLASLSKLFSATVALRLDESGELPLSTPLGDIWPDKPRGLATVSLEALLRHRGGFEPWFPLYARRLAVHELLTSEFRGRRKATYSDLGFMVWACSVERALGRSLYDLLRSHLLYPLGLLRDVRIAPPDRRRLVECRLGNDRERRLAGKLGCKVERRRPGWGEVQDGNAHWLGGFPGHAGLFGSARSLWCLAREWVAPRVLPPGLVEKALQGSGPFRLGWWRLEEAVFWHPGFTGGSVAIDTAARRVEVLLTHRSTADASVEPFRAALRKVR